ncbi:hypothetical protein N2152v2_001804 [Parachlorella kessleri]
MEFAPSEGGVAERRLVLSVLHSCQGISGRYIYLQGGSDASSGFLCQPGAEIPITQQQLIGKITELGWLLKKITDLSAQLSALQSPVHEALVAAAQREVNNYYRLVAILEAQAQQQASGGSGTSSAAAAAATPTNASYLTLRRLKVWLSEPLGRLRIVAGCLDTTRQQQGGQVINTLHAMSKHGDPLVRKVVGPLLEEACVPYFKQISCWVLDGSLDASRTDFMISKHTAGTDLSSVWRKSFRLNTTMQPSFISKELAQQILTAGKTINFLRELCGDSEWVPMVSSTAHSLGASSGTYQQLRWLEQAVDDVNRCVSGHLLDIIMRRQGLVAHLGAVKRFLLLGQGDFVQSLLDLVEGELDKPAREVSQYTLQGHLDTALRSSSAAGDDPDMLRRVDVRLQRTMDGDRGWDTFSLQYHLDGPMAAVFSQDNMTTYLRVFRLLWTIKHVEHVLAAGWHTINDIQHGLATLRNLHSKEGIDVDNIEQVPAVLRSFHAKRSEMAQFVTSLQYYIVFEVLEPAWARFMQQLRQPKDLDEVIALHDATLEAITKGMFLDNTPVVMASGSGSADVQAGLRQTLRAVLDMQGPIKRLAGAVEQAVAEAQMYLQAVNDSERGGTWNEQPQRPSIQEEVVQEVHSGMWRVHSAFDRHFRTFLSLLPAQSHLDLRFFLSRIDFVDGLGALDHGAPRG